MRLEVSSLRPDIGYFGVPRVAWNPRLSTSDFTPISDQRGPLAVPYAWGMTSVARAHAVSGMNGRPRAWRFGHFIALNSTSAKRNSRSDYSDRHG
jgi:hypothetical protein